MRFMRPEQQDEGNPISDDKAITIAVVLFQVKVLETINTSIRLSVSIGETAVD